MRGWYGSRRHPRDRPVSPSARVSRPACRCASATRAGASSRTASTSSATPPAFARVEPPTVSVLPGREAEIERDVHPAGRRLGAVGLGAVRRAGDVGGRGVLLGRRRGLPRARRRRRAADVGGQQRRRPAGGRARYGSSSPTRATPPPASPCTARDPRCRPAGVGRAGADRPSSRRPRVDAAQGQGAPTVPARLAVRTASSRSTAGTCRSACCRPSPADGADDPSDPDQRTLQLTFQQKPVLSKLMLVGSSLLAAALLLAFVVLRLRQTDELVARSRPPRRPHRGSPPRRRARRRCSCSGTPCPNALGYQIRNTTNAGEMGAEVGRRRRRRPQLHRSTSSTRAPSTASPSSPSARRAPRTRPDPAPVRHDDARRPSWRPPMR